MEEIIEIIDTNEPIHEFFGLSYAHYLVLPRSILQSLPIEMQQQIVDIATKIDEMYDWKQDGGYYVTLRDYQGRMKHDPYLDYERGRRRIDPIKEIKD